jgi:aspartate aminotransferase
MSKTITSPLSERANNIKDSITMAVTDLGNQLKKEGHRVISFSAGEPDFDTPQSIKEAGINSIKAGKTKYTAASGIIELKNAVVKKFKNDNNLTYTNKDIVISCGAKHSIYNTLIALINTGDEVIVPSPYWVSYPDQVELVGGKPIIIEATDKAGFKITPAQLEAAITPRTKMVIINSPSNPTGAIYTKQELQALADVVLKHDNIYVLSDEIYEELVYDGTEHYSIASLSKEMQDRTVVINGVSKAYSMTGWRIGYTGSTTEIASAMGKIQSQTTSNPTVASQWASLEALEGSQEAVETMRISFESRRNLMVKELNKIKGMTCLTPPGAFYTFPNVSALYGKTSPEGLVANDVDFCAQLLTLYKVACVPGSGFGAPDHIRLTYTASAEDIKEGIDKIKLFVESLK